MSNATTQIVNGRGAIIRGAIKASEVVCSTMGVGKRSVVIYQQDRMPFPSPDGATVATNIKLEDPFERIGSDWVLEAARRTAKEAGDGTTTTCALVGGMLKNVDLKKSRRQIVDELREAGEIACEEIRNLAIPVEDEEDLRKIAIISANNDPELGNLIADVVWKVGKSGTVYVENDFDAHKTRSEIKKGYTIKPGLMSSFFGRSIALENPLTILIDDNVFDYRSLLPIYALHKKNFLTPDGFTRSLVIFAKDISGAALESAIATFRQGVPVVLVRVGGEHRADVFEDLKVITNTPDIWCEATGHPLSKFGKVGYQRQDYFGQATKVMVDNQQATVFFKEEDAAAHIINLETIRFEGSKEVLRRERVSKLTNGVGYIYVGGASNSEMTDKGQLTDDAQSACFSSLEHGYLPGGGTVLLKISEELPNTYGGRLLAKAFREPLKIMLRNSDFRTTFGTGKYVRNGYVFNMKTGKFEHEEVTEVLDAAKAMECAVRNAISVVCEIVKSDNVILWQ